MSNRRVALLIACETYIDPSLHRLQAPKRDVADLADALGNEEIGGYEVKVLTDREHTEVDREIERLSQSCQRGDTLLLYFSCHGVTDDDGHLLFAMADTRPDTRSATSLSAQKVNSHLHRCRASQQILLLDCCYGGAFAQTLRPKGIEGQKVSLDTGKYFTRSSGGNGLFLLSATDDVNLCYERDGNSLFTRTIVEGLRTGAADMNNDGLVSMDELYDYVYQRLSMGEPPQKPRKWALGVEGPFSIAKSAARPGAGLSMTAQWPTSRDEPARRRASGPAVEIRSGGSNDATPASNRKPRKRTTTPGESAIPTAAASSAQVATSGARERGSRSGKNTAVSSASPPSARSSQSLSPLTGQIDTPARSAMRRGRKVIWLLGGAALAAGIGGAAWQMSYGLRALTRSIVTGTSASAPLKPQEDEPNPQRSVLSDAAAQEKAPLLKRRGGEMVQVTGGLFSLGSSDKAAQNPPHMARLSSFEIDKTEVTIASYGECVKARVCAAPLSRDAKGYCNWGIVGREDHPVNCVSYVQAERFCQWAGKRLPTEDEWELAARGQDGRRYPWGDLVPSPGEGNGCGAGCEFFQKTHRQSPQALAEEPDRMLLTAPVGSFPGGVSPFGLLDAAGNVWEWAQPADGRLGPTRPSLGGSWQSNPRMHFRADRRHTVKDDQYGHTGFRCAASMTGPSVTTSHR